MSTKKSSTKVRNVKQFVTRRAGCPEIGSSVIIAGGYPKRHISATITGVVELNGNPVQFIVMSEGGKFERHIFIAEVAAYRWNIPAVVTPAAAQHYEVQ